ncbi:membrane protein [Betaproteobacteria bacterium]|nr:membrane protein [Betaproteobacteria bacterium]
MTEKTQLFRGYLAVTLTLLLWSGFSLVSRLGGKSVLTPYDVFALRLIVALPVLLPFAGSMPPRVWADRKLWLLTCLCSLIYCPLAYSGFKYAPAAHGGILLSGLQPFLISAVAWLIAGTRPGRVRSIGLCLIGAGIVCAAMPYLTEWSAEYAFGDLLIFLSSVLWAFYGVLAARWSYSPWTLTRAIVYASAIVYLPIYLLWLPKELSNAPLSAIIIQGAFQGLSATILAMLTYLKSLELLGPDRTASFLALVPLVVGILAVPLLNEPLTPWLGSGIVFVSLGSYVASKARHV